MRPKTLITEYDVITAGKLGSVMFAGTLVGIAAKRARQRRQGRRIESVIDPERIDTGK